MLAGLAEVAVSEQVTLGSSNTERITAIKFNSKTKRAGFAVKKQVIL
jgi:hypothetical protein